MQSIAVLSIVMKSHLLFRPSVGLDARGLVKKVAHLFDFYTLSKYKKKCQSSRLSNQVYQISLKTFRFGYILASRYLECLSVNG
jgi:hypothetical protein